MTHAELEARMRHNFNHGDTMKTICTAYVRWILETVQELRCDTYPCWKMEMLLLRSLHRRAQE